MTLKLLDSSGAVVAQTSGKTSPLTLDVPSVPAGSYTYVVSASGLKGSLSFTLTVTAPA